VKDAQIKFEREEYARSMGLYRQGNDAALTSALIMLSKEECVLGMEQSSNYAALKDAQIMLRRVECALSMEQRSHDAALKGAPIKLRREEYARDMVHTATPLMNLQLLHHILDQNLKRLLRHFPTRVMCPLQ